LHLWICAYSGVHGGVAELSPHNCRDVETLLKGNVL
jgi:hypothetical protein